MRFDGEDSFAPATVICNETYAETIADDFATGEPALLAIIAEPGRRDTAAAAALAAFHIQDVDPEGYVLLLPSDHHIRRPGAFSAAIRAAATTAQSAINTFGVIPVRPDTGFGYIQRDEASEKVGELFKVEAFVEKPDAATAQTYLDSGVFYWNAGIFLYRPDTFLNELQRLQPGIYAAVKRGWEERRENCTGPSPILMPSASFLDSEAISLDYAVMEKTSLATVMPIDIGWDDLGSWGALHTLHGPDGHGNVARGDAHLFDCENTYVEAGSRLVVATGVSDLIIVDTPDALLVCGADASQGVKAVHSQLMEMKRTEADYHPDRSSRRLALRQWYRTWLLDEALPLWSGLAIDAQTGLPFESLDYSAEPLEDTVRTRVLSRQIFSYAFAADQLCWDKVHASDLIARLMDVYMDRVKGGGKSATKLLRSGKVADATWDTYDQAFHLLATAWAYRATGDNRYADIGLIALKDLNDGLKHDAIGYMDTSDGSLPRRANPHMHLLEASLAWLDTDKRAEFEPMAKTIVDLFHTKFCDAGLLFERFDDTLTVIKDGADDVTAIEPGHLYEWATLVKLAGDQSIGSEWVGRCSAMVGFADTYGQNPKSGLVFDTCSADGQRTSGTHRLWPQTEKIRHHLLFGTPKQQDDALSTLERVRKNYLDPRDVTGLWRDKLSEDLNDLGDRSPASTLYHLMNMIAVI